MTQQQATEIRLLVGYGQTENAIKKLQQANIEEALQLLAQFNEAKRSYSLNLIDFSQYNTIIARITNSILELAKKADSGESPVVNVEAPGEYEIAFKPTKGNPLVVLGKAISELREMQHNRTHNIERIEQLVQRIDSLASLPESILDEVEGWGLKKFQRLSPPEQLNALNAVISDVLSLEETLRKSLNQYLDESIEATASDWRRLRNKFFADPTEQNLVAFKEAIEAFAMDEQNEITAAQYRALGFWIAQLDNILESQTMIPKKLQGLREQKASSWFYQ